MSYTVRSISEDDYNMACEWWNLWNFTPPPIYMLPNNGNDGLLISYNGEPICLGYLYATSSPYLYHLEFVVSNKKVSNRNVRRESKKLLINALCDVAKNQGALAIYTSLNSKFLIPKFEECGFLKSSENCVEMVRTFS